MQHIVTYIAIKWFTSQLEGTSAEQGREGDKTKEREGEEREREIGAERQNINACARACTHVRAHTYTHTHTRRHTERSRQIDRLRHTHCTWASKY